MTKILDMTGGKKEDSNAKVKNTIYELKANLPLILEIAKMKSTYQRERMTTLRREGFTEEQALDIVKTENTPFDN